MTSKGNYTLEEIAIKPHCKQGSRGMGKPVPLSRTDFFSTI